MLKIIPGATGYFNKTLNSNQFDNEDAIKDKLDNRGSIKGKLNNIYGKVRTFLTPTLRCPMEKTTTQELLAQAEKI
ncbi:hypothetical protein PJ235_23875, partial [Escherichia coli]|nr:hypothetical protein [Escherichia coli]